MSCDYYEIEQLQKRIAEANCKSELQKRTAKNEPQTQNGVGVYLRATVHYYDYDVIHISLV